MAARALEGIDIFVAVVEKGGFAAAARSLGMTTSAVSKQIAKLEARLKSRLLQRTTRRLSLTEAGDAFYAHAQRALAAATAGHEALIELNSVPRGQLRLSTPMSFGILHIAPAITRFMDAFPEIRVDMVLDDRVQDLVAGGFDLAVRIGMLGSSGSIVARRLTSASGVLCASDSYSVRRGLPRAPAELLHHDTLLYAHEPGAHEWHLTGPTGLESVAIEPRLVS